MPKDYSELMSATGAHTFEESHVREIKGGPIKIRAHYIGYTAINKALDKLSRKINDMSDFFREKYEEQARDNLGEDTEEDS